MVGAVAGGRGGAHYSRVLEFGLLLSRLGPLPFVGRACNSEARFAVSGRLLASLSPAGSRTVPVIFRTARLRAWPHPLDQRYKHAVQRSARQKRSPKKVCYGLVVSIMFLFTLFHCRKASKYTLHCMILLPSFFCVHPKENGLLSL